MVIHLTNRKQNNIRHEIMGDKRNEQNKINEIFLNKIMNKPTQD